MEYLDFVIDGIDNGWQSEIAREDSGSRLRCTQPHIQEPTQDILCRYGF